jgi:hypothetical protein
MVRAISLQSSLPKKFPSALLPYFFTLSYDVALLPLSSLFGCHKTEKELGDTLDDGGIDVVEAATIEGTVFVLPCVKEQGDVFPTSEVMKLQSIFLCSLHGHSGQTFGRRKTCM